MIADTSRVHTNDRVAITAAVQDYVQGWYQADATRMERSLHPDLVKRLVRNEADGQIRMHELDAATLVNAVRERAGSEAPAVQQQIIAILGIYAGIATVQAEMNDWVDYLHLARFEDGWKIVNAIWALKPREVA
ncbi:MAG: nuclear transport factor 2 family protein [Oscillochloridaceae bacterium umkhey_bin13]